MAEKSGGTIRKVVKTQLKNITKSDEIYKEINEYVIKVSKIVNAGSLFVKYILINEQYSVIKNLINKEFFEECLSHMTSNRKNNVKNTNKIYYRSIIDKHLTTFLEKYSYEPIDFLYSQQTFNYEAVKMNTSFLTNIQEHLGNHIRSFVNKRLNIKQRIKDLKDNKEEISKVKQQGHRLKLLVSSRNPNKEKLDSLPDLERKIYNELNDVLYNNNDERINEKGLYYDIKEHTENWIISILALSKLFEEYNYKNFNAIPLKRKFYSSYVIIDFKILNLNILHNVQTKPQLEKKDSYELWNMCFKTEKKIFKTKTLKFHGILMTDGVGVSIILQNKESKFGTNKKKKSIKIEEPYIENNIGKATLGKCLIVDPNMRDLIYTVHESSTIKNKKVFRYTNEQRKMETRSKKYKKIREEIKPKKIQELETLLSKNPFRTCDIEKYNEFLITKGKIEFELRKHYDQYIYKKLKLNSYINKQRSEDKLINNIKNKFGKDTVIIMGDCSKSTMKYHEPVKGKGFRKLFKKNNLEVFLIDEFRTSSYDPITEEKVERFKKINSPRPWRKNKIVTCNGLLRRISQKNNSESTGKLWNRDLLACLNMIKILTSLRKIHTRPILFARTPSTPDS